MAWIWAVIDGAIGWRFGTVLVTAVHAGSAGGGEFAATGLDAPAAEVRTDLDTPLRFKPGQGIRIAGPSAVTQTKRALL